MRKYGFQKTNFSKPELHGVDPKEVKTESE